MQDKSNFHPEKFFMLDFKLLKGQVDTPENFVTESIVGHNVVSGFDLKFNIPEKLVRAEFKVTITTESKGKNQLEATGSFVFVYIYKVENFDEVSNIDDNNLVELDGSLAHSLASITYSTSRGVLLTRLQGTAFNSFILPIINPSSLLVDSE